MYAPSAALSKLPYAPPQNPTFNPQAKSQPQRPQFSGLLAKDSPPDLGEWSGPRQGQSSNYPTTYKSGDFSIYSPGRAQPTQTPSLGTAYGQQNTQGSPYDYYNASGQKFGAVPDYAPGMSSQQMAQSYGNLANSKGYYRQPQAGLSLADSQLGFGQQPPRMWNNHVVMGGDMVVDADYYNTLRKQDPGRYPEPLQDPRSTQPAAPQNPFANMQPGVYTPYGFTPTNNPLQAQANAIAQRAAIVQQTNQALLPYQYAQATGQDFGAPQFDLAGIRQQAQKMVGDGWYNPFQRYFEQQDALQQIGQYAPPPMYGQSLPYDPAYQATNMAMWTQGQLPGGGRYTPVAPRSDQSGVDMRPQMENAGRFIRELTATNPATWTQEQWDDYQRAQRDTGLMDGASYYRDQQGNIRFGGGYRLENGPPDRVITANSRRDQYGNWGDSSGGPAPTTRDPRDGWPGPTRAAVYPNDYDPPRTSPAPGPQTQWRAEDYDWQNPLTGEVASSPSETTAARYSPDPNKTLTDRERYNFYAGKAREDGWIERRKAGAPGQAQPIQPPSQGTPYGKPAPGPGRLPFVH